MTSQDATQDIAAIRLLDEPVRRRLYDWVLAQGRPVGRDEAAQAVGIGRALAAFHLDRLAAAGLLSAGYQRLNDRRGPGAGRPARVYARGQREISVSLPSRHYDRVADVFATALERVGEKKFRAPLHEIAAETGEELAANTTGATPGDRLLTVLDDSGYEPTAEPDGTIRLRNCPFHALVEEHRSLVCGANLAMALGITEATDAGADFTPVLDPQPGYCCVAFKAEHPPQK